MKRIIAMVLALGMAAAMVACQSQEASSAEGSMPSANEDTLGSKPENEEPANQENSNVLIAYFSLERNTEHSASIDASASASLVLDGEEMVGTTEYVARLIQDNIGGNLHSIETVEPYSADFDTVVDQNHEEINAGTLPELEASDLDVSQYDTVFIGYPVWATQAPQAIFSFISQYDLSEKTIIPFCTHDGYGAGGSYGDIADAIDGEITVLDGLAVEAPDVPGAASTVSEWLSNIGIEAHPGHSDEAEETAITITIGGTVLNGILYDTALANEIREHFPLTISMVGFGDREYYGSVEFYPENLQGGQTTFENGDLTYCEAHHNMAIFYAQTDEPILSVEVIPIGKVTSDLTVLEALPRNVDVTFAVAE